MRTLSRILLVFTIGLVCEAALLYAVKNTHSHGLINLYLVLYLMVGIPFCFSLVSLIGFLSDGEDYTL